MKIPELIEQVNKLNTAIMMSTRGFPERIKARIKMINNARTKGNNTEDLERQLSNLLNKTILYKPPSHYVEVTSEYDDITIEPDNRGDDDFEEKSLTNKEKELIITALQQLDPNSVIEKTADAGPQSTYDKLLSDIDVLSQRRALHYGKCNINEITNELYELYELYPNKALGNKNKNEITEYRDKLENALLSVQNALSNFGKEKYQGNPVALVNGPQIEKTIKNIKQNINVANYILVNRAPNEEQRIVTEQQKKQQEERVEIDNFLTTIKNAVEKNDKLIENKDKEGFNSPQEVSEFLASCQETYQSLYNLHCKGNYFHKDYRNKETNAAKQDIANKFVTTSSGKAGSKYYDTIQALKKIDSSVTVEQFNNILSEMSRISKYSQKSASTGGNFRNNIQKELLSLSSYKNKNLFLSQSAKEKMDKLITTYTDWINVLYKVLDEDEQAINLITSINFEQAEKNTNLLINRVKSPDNPLAKESDEVKKLLQNTEEIIARLSITKDNTLQINPEVKVKDAAEQLQQLNKNILEFLRANEEPSPDQERKITNVAYATLNLNKLFEAKFAPINTQQQHVRQASQTPIRDKITSWLDQVINGISQAWDTIYKLWKKNPRANISVEAAQDLKKEIEMVVINQSRVVKEEDRERITKVAAVITEVKNGVKEIGSDTLHKMINEPLEQAEEQVNFDITKLNAEAQQKVKEKHLATKEQGDKEYVKQQIDIIENKNQPG